MKKSLVNLYSWENPRICVSDSEFSKGEKIVVENEFGNNIGILVDNNLDIKEETGDLILRKATARDIKAYEENEEKKEEIIKTSKGEIKRLGLEMKIIDVSISLDSSVVVIIFTADGRVDFRDLVRSLSRIFHRSVKMHQIGSRDEARKLGGCGVCGRELCCVRFSGSLPSISTEMARVQQVAHRGSERISGLCGRLMCCLSYEADQYRKLLEGMPEVGSFIKTKEGKGEVIELDVINQKAKVKIEGEGIVIVDKKNLK